MTVLSLFNLYFNTQPLKGCATKELMDIFSDWVFQFGLGHIDLTVLAQNVTDPNILGQMQKSFAHFVQTGQAWALLIGLAIGYMIRNLTSYG